jgi:hypothetical protein
MTRAWKIHVLEVLNRRGWTRDRLAKEIGVSRALVYRMFPETEDTDNEIWSSVHVSAVCEVLGVPKPYEPTDLQRDVIDRELVDLLRNQSHEFKRELLRYLKIARESLRTDEES